MTTETELTKTLGIETVISQLKINGHIINYLVCGNGPPLLLIHGANFGWGIWYPNLKEFGKHFTVYAIDLPGAGRSSRVDYATLNARKDILGTVEEFISHHGFSSLNLVGCSVGGWVALEIALLHPGKVQKIIVENTIGFADRTSFSDKAIGVYPFAKFLSQTFLKPGGNNKNIERFFRNIFYDKNINIREEFLSYFFETMETSHNLLFISRLNALVKEFVLLDKLPKIQQEVGIVWGEKDSILPLARSYRNFSLIPRASTYIIKDAGHIPSFEKPFEFNSYALSFFLKTPKLFS